jgi:hypothetical protein
LISSLSQSEEHTLGGYLRENRMLVRIFRPKREEVTGRWRKLYNQKLHNLYFSPNNIGVIKSKRMGWAGHLVYVGETKYAYRILIGKS